MFERLGELEGKELTPETFREFYKIWWTINEDTYQELFVSPEFIGLMQEVLRRGLVLRQRTDKLSAESLSTLNIPTKDDMDEIYKAIYDLRKEVRWQRRGLHELEAAVGIDTKKPKVGD